MRGRVKTKKRGGGGEKGEEGERKEKGRREVRDWVTITQAIIVKMSTMYWFW